MIKSVVKLNLVAALVLFTVQCGVKGDPLPPLQPHVTEGAVDRFGDTESTPEADKNSDEKKDRKR